MSFPFDPYGYGGPAFPHDHMVAGPSMSGHGQGQPMPQAMLRQPNISEMGGRDPNRPAWYRVPFFPTAPLYSTSPEVGYVTRYYSDGLLNQPAGAEVVQTVQFDLPCRLVAINGAAFSTAAAALPVGLNSLDTFLFRLEYVTGERLHITQRLGSTVCGTAERPGMLGGAGWTIEQGGSVQLGITPLVANMRIDIVLVCLEMRGARNFVIHPQFR